MNMLQYRQQPVWVPAECTHEEVHFTEAKSYQGDSVRHRAGTKTQPDNTVPKQFGED